MAFEWNKINLMSSFEVCSVAKGGGRGQKVVGLCHSMCYCVDAAVGYRIVFGGGTSVTVENVEDLKPSFYKLEAGNLTACLATGFSKDKAIKLTWKRSMFVESDAVQISADSLYNQVAMLAAPLIDRCDEGVSRPWLCEDVLIPDEKVNLASLNALILRLIYAKVIVINCVMTCASCLPQ